MADRGKQALRHALILDKISSGNLVMKRGAATASGSDFPNTITLSMTCSTVVGIAGPPRVRREREGVRVFHQITGVIEESIRFPGSIAFVVPWTMP